MYAQSHGHASAACCPGTTSARPVGELDRNFVVGREFTLILLAHKGEFSATYSYGQPAAVVKLKKRVKWCRFRVGCYLANDYQGTSYGQVNIRSLVVSHK